MSVGTSWHTWQRLTDQSRAYIRLPGEMYIRDAGKPDEADLAKEAVALRGLLDGWDLVATRLWLEDYAALLCQPTALGQLHAALRRITPSQCLAEQAAQRHLLWHAALLNHAIRDGIAVAWAYLTMPHAGASPQAVEAVWLPPDVEGGC